MQGERPKHVSGSARQNKRVVRSRLIGEDPHSASRVKPNYRVRLRLTRAAKRCWLRNGILDPAMSSLEGGLALAGERFWLVTKTISCRITWCLHARKIAAIQAARWIEKLRICYRMCRIFLDLGGVP